MKGIRISGLRACSYRSLAVAVSLSLAANAPLAALADSGSSLRPYRVAQAGNPAAPSPAALKAEVGTMETEQSLNLSPADRTELQQRLEALGFYSGPTDGNLTPVFRAAVGTWQKKHDLAPTGWLGPVELDAIKAESDAVGPPQPGPQPNQAAAAPAASSDKAAQETAFWESAEHSNLAADYQAYLQAYPTGLYAQMARNRIANLSSAPPANPGGPPMAPPPMAAPAAMAAPMGPPSALGPPPQPVSPEALKAEVGTIDTERELDIGPPGRIELQQRLAALGLYAGPFDGDLGPMARAAIAEWQKRHDLAPTGDLGPLQLSALRIESEGAYEQFLASHPPVGPVRVYAPVHRVYRTYAAPANNPGAGAAFGALLGGVALGLLGAKLGGGKFGGGGKGGGKGGGGKRRK
ncbi:MAG TPA: peptidoglycan-binding domain-containing protein [Roseiarcus sp.]|jgi:peptidoglycan hydrolase-like protein with peptidoglycan-binding domain